jgi:CBS domain-containing protein
MVANGLREAPVLDEHGVIVGFINEADASRAYLEATKRLTLPADAMPLAHP